MTRSELVAIIAQKAPHLQLAEAEKAVNAVLKNTTKLLANGDRLELRGFGSFFVTNRGPKQGRNPKTGDIIKISAKAVPRFKCSKLLIEAMNAGKYP